MDIWLALLLLVIGIAVYLLGYLAIPLIVASTTKLTKAKINLTIIINTIVVFVLFQIINPYLTTNIVMGVITAFIARRIMISKWRKSEKETEQDSVTTE